VCKLRRCERASDRGSEVGTSAAVGWDFEKLLRARSMQFWCLICRAEVIGRHAAVKDGDWGDCKVCGWRGLRVGCYWWWWSQTWPSAPTDFFFHLFIRGQCHAYRFKRDMLDWRGADGSGVRWGAL
jgi:hypothetical protein